jgi:hypothetical protein
VLLGLLGYFLGEERGEDKGDVIGDRGEGESVSGEKWPR